MAKIQAKITVKADIKLSLERLYEFYHKAETLKDKIKFSDLIRIELKKK